MPREKPTTPKKLEQVKRADERLYDGIPRKFKIDPEPTELRPNISYKGPPQKGGLILKLEKFVNVITDKFLNQTEKSLEQEEDIRAC